MTTVPKIYSLEPVLVVNDLEATLKHYKEVLGFTIDWRWPDEGQIDHASVSFGQGHEDPAHDSHHHIHVQLSQSDDQPVTNSGWLYLRVDDDIDKLYDNMKARGALISQELGDRPWGMREFDIKDNNGHVFRFAYPLSVNEVE